MTLTRECDIIHVKIVYVQTKDLKGDLKNEEKISLFLIFTVILTAFTVFAEENYKASDWAREELKRAEEIANHYGIKSVNVYDYMQEDYNKIKDQKGYKTFTDYLSAMYSKSGSGFDVHGGYAKYGEAMVKAFTEDYDACMAVPKNAGIYCMSQKKIVGATYKQIFADSSAIRYSGKWDTYTADNKFQTSDAKATISDTQYSYPFFTHGIKQVMNDAAAFGFTSGAEAFCLNYTASSAGSSAKVYIDGTESGVLSCYSQYHGVNYISEWISLPNDGKQHKVTVMVNSSTYGNYVFRFGSVIERYAK